MAAKIVPLSVCYYIFVYVLCMCRCVYACVFSLPIFFSFINIFSKSMKLVTGRSEYHMLSFVYCLLYTVFVYGLVVIASVFVEEVPRNFGNEFSHCGYGGRIVQVLFGRMVSFIHILFHVKYVSKYLVYFLLFSPITIHNCVSQVNIGLISVL